VEVGGDALNMPATMYVDLRRKKAYVRGVDSRRNSRVGLLGMKELLKPIVVPT